MEYQPSVWNKVAEMTARNRLPNLLPIGNFYIRNCLPPIGLLPSVPANLDTGLGGCLLCKLCHMTNDGSKVGGSPELDRAEGSVVGLHHTGDPNTVGILRDSIESKLVGHMTTNLTAKAKSWKQFVTEHEGSKGTPLSSLSQIKTFL